MERKQFNKDLIRRYRDNKASNEELEVLFYLFSDGELEKELEEVMNEDAVKEEEPAIIIPLYKRTWFRVAVAAILVVGSFTLYKLAGNSFSKSFLATKPVLQDVAPGSNKAVLTLADGSQIVLDSKANGVVTSQGNIKILKLETGQLAYKRLAASSGEVLYNTITTPRGGQYQLILADNTRVWLNAASSLRFPAIFSGNERRVELTGEGYFEVSKNAAMPFKVNVAGKGEVEVLGTHFNINSYADESTINTTLLEGKVRVTPWLDSKLKVEDAKLIAPGQMARLNSNGEIIVNKNADIEEVMAWKNGMFNFSNASLELVMRQLSRWYDVDVVFEGGVPQREFAGEMQRNLNLSQVLSILEINNVHFRIDGKKLYVK